MAAVLVVSACGSYRRMIEAAVQRIAECTPWGIAGESETVTAASGNVSIVLAEFGGTGSVEDVTIGVTGSAANTVASSRASVCAVYFRIRAVGAFSAENGCRGYLQVIAAASETGS